MTSFSSPPTNRLLDGLGVFVSPSGAESMRRECGRHAELNQEIEGKIAERHEVISSERERRSGESGPVVSANFDRKFDTLSR